MAIRWFGFLLLFAVVLTGFVLARPLLAIDETRYLAVAWEMHLSGDVFHLTRNFESYAHKPPLLFWLINLVWLGTGVTELAARLVGPAAGLGVVIATGLLARRLWPDLAGVGLRAMMILASFSVFAIYASATMFDALLSLLVIAGIASLWRIGTGRHGAGEWVIFGGILGLGVLAKGPVVLVHLFPALGLIGVWGGVPPAGRQILRGTGLAVLVALGVISVWLVPALLTGDAAFRHELLWTQTAARVTGEMGHGRPLWFLVALLPVIAFPWGWSWRVWIGVGRSWRADRGLWLCLIWFLGGVVVLSLVGGKQAHYLLPQLPALALVMARALPEAGWTSRGGSLAPLGAILAGLALLLISAGVVPQYLGDGISIGRVASAIGGLAFIGVAIGSWRLALGTGHVVLGLGMPVVLHGLLVAGGFGAALDTRPIADALVAVEPDGIAVIGMPYNADFNFKARMTGPVATPSDAVGLADWLGAHPKGWVIGPVGRTGAAAAPAQQWIYRGDPFGLWRGADFAGP